MERTNRGGSFTRLVLTTPIAWLCGLLAIAPGTALERAEHNLPRQQDEEVRALQAALQRYQEIVAAGGWQLLAGGRRVEPGTQDPRIPLLRARLRAEGYSSGADQPEEDRYDPALESAVRRFQALHGLDEDGVIGPATLDALNISAAIRTEAIARNLQLRRALPDSLGERYILVNSAAFTLQLIERGHTVLQLRTIVGRRDWQTPVVSSPITELIFRPLWRVPRSIATKEILPLVRRNPGYFAKTGMRVFRDSADGKEVDPSTVDWTKVTSRTLVYQFVQEPGPVNPLGGVKFFLRTPFDVFLHDTPGQALFERRQRAFSHGCVRVEHAEQLAGYLLPDWPSDSIRAAMHTGRERRVPLAAPIPAHLVYWTAWVEADGWVAFREDIYRRFK